MTPFIGAIFPFGFNFAPQGWAFCFGQLISIAENDALFALIGTTYGGDGVNTFALPDFRGRAPIHQGQGAGLSNYVLGQKAGSENVTLTANQLPSHNHNFLANNGLATVGIPVANSSLASPKDVNNDVAYMYSQAVPNTTINNATIGPAGGSQPHSNLQPSLAMNYCIALFGIFPARN
jgi:microcystin-dependent protein